MKRNGGDPKFVPAPETREQKKLYMPLRPFFWTPDQIAQLLEVNEKTVRDKMLWYSGREPGLKPKDRIKTINLAAYAEEPIWRIPEDELIKWLRFKGIKIYERGYVE